MNILTVGRYSFGYTIGASAVYFFIERKYMDKWYLDFKVESEEQLKEYVEKIINKWK